MNVKGKYSVTVNDKFFDAPLAKYYQELGADYMESWINMKLVLFQVDRIKTNVDDLYGETRGAEDVKYHTPIELPCIYEINDSENKSYLKHNNTFRYKQSGNIEIYIYDKTLMEYGCDIKYGDLIGVVIDEHTMFYYEVTDDGKRNFSNAETMYGHRQLWRTVKGAEIDENVFNG